MRLCFENRHPQGDHFADGSGRPSPLDRLHAVAQAQAAAAAVLPERHGSGSTLPSDKPVALTTHHHSQEDVLLSPPTSIADFTGSMSHVYLAQHLRFTVRD